MIDLNADMGEGSGVDTDLVPLITSVNIACGGHAGDETTMRESISLALANGVGIGAHPSYPDRDGFGRRSISMSPAQVRQEIEAQIRALAALAEAAGTSLQHIKPHGALYNQAASDRELAMAIGDAVMQVDSSLIVIALAGSDEIGVLRQMGLRVAQEAFIDREYGANGSLVSRAQPGAVISDAHWAAARAARLLRDHTLTAVNGAELEIRADTLCIHSDTPGSVELARAVRAALLDAGIVIAPLSDVMARPQAPGPRPV